MRLHNFANAHTRDKGREVKSPFALACRSSRATDLGRSLPNDAVASSERGQAADMLAVLLFHRPGSEPIPVVISPESLFDSNVCNGVRTLLDDEIAFQTNPTVVLEPTEICM